MWKGMQPVSLLLLFLAGCGDPCGEKIPPEKATVVDPAKCGTIQGRVEFRGTFDPKVNPEINMAECQGYHEGKVRDQRLVVTDGRVKNAFVYVKSGLEKYVFATPDEPALITNDRCLFVPRVSGAMVYQRIRFNNRDSITHNVNAGDLESLNVGLTAGSYREWCGRKAQVMIPLRCSLHGWMLGYLGILNHPKFAVTKEDGAFVLPGLPEGDYTIEVWHETLGTKTATATIRAGVTQTLPFEFDRLK